jgi:hypothetical protein
VVDRLNAEATAPERFAAHGGRSTGAGRHRLLRGDRDRVANGAGRIGRHPRARSRRIAWRCRGARSTAFSAEEGAGSTQNMRRNRSSRKRIRSDRTGRALGILDDTVYYSTIMTTE